MRLGMRLGLLVCAGLVASGGARAHLRSESFSAWTWDAPLLSARFTINARESTRLPHAATGAYLGQVLAIYLADRVKPIAAGGRCTVDAEFAPVPAREGFLQAEARWRCDSPPRGLELPAFLDLAAEHAHFATYRDGLNLQQRLITADAPRWLLRQPGKSGGADGSGSFSAYVVRGFNHILSGADHIVFLVALWLVCRRFRDVFWALSGFTLGHSLSLGLAALGLVEPNIPAIEATIGLTVALVAVERTASLSCSLLLLAGTSAAFLLGLALLAAWVPASLSEPALAGLALFAFCYLMLARDMAANGGFRLLVTALFGLVHGLGFAGAFLAMELSSGAIAWPLAGFNIGVELGQLALVGAMLIAARLARGVPAFAPRIVDFAVAGICGIGVFWLVGRAFA